MEIKISYERYEQIKRMVVDMFVNYEVTCVPINAFEIAYKMGITVIPYSMFPPSTNKLLLKKSTDCFSVEDATGKWWIFYNNIENYGRVNNTIMHELGHIILDHSEDSDLAEAEVRFFAKYALVPPPLVLKMGISDYTQIITTFDVSTEAAKNAWDYFCKWLNYSGKHYFDYEKALLKQFNMVSA